MLDADRDDVVTVDQLQFALGRRGFSLLACETSEPIARVHWDGSDDAFAALDANRDGRIDRDEIVRGLGREVRSLLIHGAPPGPEVPPGAEYAIPNLVGGLWVVFPGREAKARYMAEAPARDAKDPRVMAWARQFSILPLDERAAAILRFCQLAIRYARDPAWFDRAGKRHGIEVLESSAVVLHRGFGDCDAKVRLFLTLCRLCGVPAKLDPVFAGEDGFPHVRARVLQVGETGASSWEVADPTIVNSTIGHLPRHNHTHMPRFRRTSAGHEEVSVDDGVTWRRVTTNRSHLKQPLA